MSSGASRVRREPSVPARLLDEERVKFERRSQKVLAILAKKDDRIKELEKDIQEHPLRKKLEEAQSREKELLDKAMDQGEQIEVLVAELAKLRESQAQAQNSSKEEYVAHQTQRTENAKLQVALETSEKHREDLRTKLRNTNSAADEARARLAELESEKAVLSDLLETAKRTALEDEAELRKARAQIKSLQTDASREHPSDQRARQLELQVRQMAEELNELRKENSALKVSLSKFSTAAVQNPSGNESSTQPSNSGFGKGSSPQGKQSTIDPTHEASMRQLEALVLQQSEEIVDLRSQLVRAGARERESKESSDFERRSLLNKVRTLEQQLRVASENGVIHRKNLEATVRVLSGKSDLHRKYAEQADAAAQLAMVKVESEGRIIALESELAHMREEINHVRDALRRSDRDLHGFRTSAVYADVPATSHTIILQRLAKQLDEHKVKLAELSVSASTYDQYDNKGRSSQARHDVQSEGHDRVSMAAQLIALPDEDSLPMSQTQQERVFAQLRLRIHGLQVQLEDRNEEIASLEQRLTDQVTAQQTLEEELEAKALEAEKQHAEQLSVMNRRIVSHVREKHILVEEKAELSNSLESSRATQRVAEERLALLRSEHLERCKALQRHVEELEIELEGARGKQRVAEICYEQDKARLGFLEETLAVLQDQNQGIDPQDTQACREQMFADLTDKANRAESQVTTQQRTIGKLEDDLRQLRLERSTLAANLERAQHEVDEAEAQRQEEAQSAQEARKRHTDVQRQLEEAKQYQVRIELQHVDESSSREAAIVERDVLAGKLTDLGLTYTKELQDEHRATQEILAALQSDMEAIMTDIGHTPVASILRQILDHVRSAREKNGNSDHGDVRALERMADAILQSEQARFAVEAKLKSAEWAGETLSSRVQRMAKVISELRAREAKEDASIRGLERRAEVETSIRQLQHERRLKLESDRAAFVEKLLVRASAQLRAQACRSRTLERLARSHGIEIEGSLEAMDIDAEEDLVGDVHALKERTIQLEGELAESSLRLEQYKATTDGEGEKHKTFMERERKLAEGFKMEASILRDQLQESKREMVNLAFEYETKIMLHESAPALEEMGNPAELRMRMLEQAKEINELHAKLAQLQEELSAAETSNAKLEARLSSGEFETPMLSQPPLVSHPQGRDGWPEQVENNFNAEDNLENSQNSEQYQKDRSEPPLISKELEKLSEQTAYILLEQKDAQIKRLRAEADILTRRLSDAARANKSLSAANANVVSTLQKFQRHLEKRGPSAAASADGIAEKLQSFLSLLQGIELEEAVKRFNTVLDRYDREREQQRATEQKELLRLREEAHELRARMAEDEAVRHEQLRAIASSQSLSEAEINSMRSRLEMIQKERDEMHANLVKVEDKLRRQMVQIETLESLESELFTLREREVQLISEKDEAVRSAREELETKTAILKEQVESLESGKAIGDARAEERRRLQGRMKALEKRAGEYKATAERFKDQLAALRGTWASPEIVGKLRSDLSQSRAEVRKYRSDAARKRTMLQAATEKATEEKGAEDDLRKRASQLEAQARAAQAEARNKENLIQASKQSSEKAKLELLEAQQELESLREKVKNLTRERTALRSRIDALKQDQKQHHTTGHAALQGNISDAQNAAQMVVARDTEKELSNKVDRWKRRATSAENQLENARTKLLSLETKSAETDQELNTVKEAVTTLKQKIRTSERELQQANSQIKEMEGLAEANHNETIELERALHATLLKVSDEAIEVRRKCYDVKLSSGHGYGSQTEQSDADAVAKMLELSPEDLRDLFGAEARCNDPSYSAALKSLQVAVERHKAFVNQIFQTRGSLPSRLSSSELRRIVDSTCALWRT